MTDALLISPSGKRTQPRVGLPATITMEGVDYRTTDWSIGGFKLERGKDNSKPGDIHRARMVIHCKPFDVTLDLNAQVVSANDAGVALHFRFVDATADQVQVLRQVIDDYLAGDVTTIDRLMDPETGRRSVIVPANSGHGARALLRSMIYVAVLVLLIGILALSVIGGVLTKRATVAAVTAEGSFVRSPGPGTISGETLLPNQTIRKGDKLYSLSVAAQGDHKPEDIRRKIAELQVKLESQMSELSEIQLLTRTEETRARAATYAARSEVGSIQRQISSQRSILARAITLHQNRVGPAQDVDEARVALHALERDLGVSRLRLATAEADLSTIGTGITRNYDTNNRPSVAQTEAAIRTTQAEIALQQTALAELDQSLTIAAPCDCVVDKVYARNGEFVREGDKLYQLRNVNDRKFRVDALVPVTDARLLRVGEGANVELANGKEIDGVKIQDINFLNDRDYRVGMPQTFTAEPMALVSMSTDKVLAENMIGVPALVTYHVGISNYLRYLLGGF